MTSSNIRFIGLDVHKESIEIAIAEDEAIRDIENDVVGRRRQRRSAVFIHQRYLTFESYRSFFFCSDIC